MRLQSLIKGARDVKAQYGDLDQLIATLESAAKECKDSGERATG